MFFAGIIVNLLFLVLLSLMVVVVIRGGIALFKGFTGVSGAPRRGGPPEIIRLPTPAEVQARVTKGEISQDEANCILQDLILPPHPPAPANSGGAMAVVFSIIGAAVLGGVLALSIALVWALLDAKFGGQQP